MKKIQRNDLFLRFPRPISVVNRREKEKKNGENESWNWVNMFWIVKSFFFFWLISVGVVVCLYGDFFDTTCASNPNRNIHNVHQIIGGKKNNQRVKRVMCVLRFLPHWFRRIILDRRCHRQNTHASDCNLFDKCPGKFAHIGCFTEMCWCRSRWRWNT